MTCSNDSSDDFAPRAAAPERPLGPCVGIGLPRDVALKLAEGRPILSVDPSMIANAGLDRLQGAIVACMLFGGEMDAVDVILSLVKAGYTGPVVVGAPPMPSPRMVQAELSRAGKGLKVKLTVI